MMKSLILTAAALLFFAAFAGQARAEFETDRFEVPDGELIVTFLGHGSLMLDYNGKIIQVDPYGQVADYSALPDADLILITHQHRDHLDPDALKEIRTSQTEIILTRVCAQSLDGGEVMQNGDVRTWNGVQIQAAPAYNRIHMRDNGQPFHPKGEGNGYVLDFNGFRVYIAGDTENIPEMGELQFIDVAFLPMNLPYTMTPEMTADAARSFMPRILYPYHYGQTDPAELTALLADSPEIEVRIRQMQ